ncbi:MULTISPECIES: acyl-CoA carboxylase subunit epsilon [unclassified Streptomyces]|uniref:acyl-CoA carboxylase subunit epsilon n=1 Tax=Streptomycetaceae TaxID=2062 RepID=UPI002E797895|nr:MULTISPECIES: acyl-CoA carboxylase subunit epsilon [unclassified Streptomyces]MED7951623.1 acyl-CoA carboxylase subunit epsilon [Streptomyces sp. BE303]MEE1829040.1 acyl-CoA carboxylase subunit epsilon [Streptomyces sp. BE20]
MTASAEPLVRIVRGSLTDEELAALTAVLMARAASAQHAASAASPVEPIANWQRLERRPAYYSPVSWQWAA